LRSATDNNKKVAKEQRIVKESSWGVTGTGTTECQTKLLFADYKADPWLAAGDQ